MKTGAPVSAELSLRTDALDCRCPEALRLLAAVDHAPERRLGGRRTGHCGCVPLRFRNGGQVSAVRAVSAPGPATACRCPLDGHGWYPPAGTAPVCGCPRLQEPVAWSASAGGMQPPPVRLANLAGQPVAELLAHQGHGRPLQRQHLIARQPAKP
jgi:hypothetical protein